jgi:hypothetical protein
MPYFPTKHAIALQDALLQAFSTIAPAILGLELSFGRSLLTFAYWPEASCTKFLAELSSSINVCGV